MAFQNRSNSKTNNDVRQIRNPSSNQISDDSQVTIDAKYMQETSSELELEGQEKQTVSSTVLEISTGSNLVLELNNTHLVTSPRKTTSPNRATSPSKVTSPASRKSGVNNKVIAHKEQSIKRKPEKSHKKKKKHHSKSNSKKHKNKRKHSKAISTNTSKLVSEKHSDSDDFCVKSWDNEEFEKWSPIVSKVSPVKKATQLNINSFAKFREIQPSNYKSKSIHSTNINNKEQWRVKIKEIDAKSERIHRKKKRYKKADDKLNMPDFITHLPEIKYDKSSKINKKSKDKSSSVKKLSIIDYPHENKKSKEKKIDLSKINRYENEFKQSTLKIDAKNNMRHSQHRKKDIDSSEYRDSSFYAFQKKKQNEIWEEQKLKTDRELRNIRRTRVSENSSTYIKSFNTQLSNRPKRTTKKPDYLIFYEGGKTMNGSAQGYDQYMNPNDHTLIKPSKHNEETEQPIEVNLSLESLLIMTIHSHLHSNEIIGYLGGHYINWDSARTSWNKKKQLIFLQHSYPWEPLTLSEHEKSKIDRTRNVEVDPESADIARKNSEENGEKLLAWYHSHPFFEVYPSQLDVANHWSYQSQWNKDNQPYVGLIIGPYTK